MNKIVALDCGSQFHLISLHREPFKKYLEKTIYLPELKKSDLDEAEILVVSDCSSIKQILDHKNLIYEFLNSAKVVVVLGRNEAETWLDGVSKIDLECNFWWWLDKKSSINIEPLVKDYELFKYAKFNDLVWHYHDGYELEGALNVIANKDNGASVFLDKKDYFGGRLILTSFDPFFHHGNFFMPNATKFGSAMLKFLLNMEIR